MKILIASISALFLTGCVTIEGIDHSVKVGKTYSLTSNWCAMSPGDNNYELFPGNCLKWDKNHYWKSKINIPDGTCIQLGRGNIHYENTVYPNTNSRLTTYYYVFTNGIEAVLSDKLIPSKEIQWEEIKETECEPS